MWFSNIQDWWFLSAISQIKIFSSFSKCVGRHMEIVNWKILIVYWSERLQFILGNVTSNLCEMGIFNSILLHYWKLGNIAFLAPTGALERLIFVCLFGESLSRALNLHLYLSGQPQVRLRLVSGQSQVSLIFICQVSLKSVSG